ncbi:hypothetical protein MCAMS1_01487 [biofilm metagenome]
MKYFKVLLFLVLCMNGWAAQAKCSGVNVVTNLTAQRYTDVGGGQARFEGGFYSSSKVTLQYPAAICS